MSSTLRIHSLHELKTKSLQSCTWTAKRMMHAATPQIKQRAKINTRSNHRTSVVYKPHTEKEEPCFLYDFCPFYLFIDKSLQLTFNANVWSSSIFRNPSFRDSECIWTSSQEPHGCLQTEESSLYRRGNQDPGKLGDLSNIIAIVINRFRANLQTCTSFFTSRTFCYFIHTQHFSKCAAQNTVGIGTLWKGKNIAGPDKV